MIIYDEQKRQLTTSEENEYILDTLNPNKSLVMKMVRLGKNDMMEHYTTIIIDDMEEYLKQLEEVE